MSYCFSQNRGHRHTGYRGATNLECICLHFCRIPVALILSSFTMSITAAGGSCGGASRCCPGRDASCLGAPDLKGRGGHCYCDEGCLETGDCCDDYKKTCNVKGEFVTLKTSLDDKDRRRKKKLKIPTSSRMHL